MGNTEAGRGINDMGIAYAVDFDELMEISGCGYGTIREYEESRLFFGGRFHTNFPAFTAGRRITQTNVATGGDAGAWEVMGDHDAQHCVSSLAFGDAT